MLKECQRFGQLAYNEYLCSLITIKTIDDMKQRLLLYLMLMLSPAMTMAATSGTDDDREARQLFEKAYNQVFGPEGCTLSYDVNLVGLYKSTGTIWYKGQKNRYEDAKTSAWCDGKTIYKVQRKKKVIDIYDANSEKADKYKNKFKFTVDDFNYSQEQKGDKLLLVLKQKKSAKGTVKEAQILLDKKTLAPVSARIKVLFFWANIKISNFKAGNISDDVFVFPKANYGKDYSYVDYRQ